MYTGATPDGRGFSLPNSHAGDDDVDPAPPRSLEPEDAHGAPAYSGKPIQSSE